MEREEKRRGVVEIKMRGKERIRKTSGDRRKDNGKERKGNIKGNKWKDNGKEIRGKKMGEREGKMRGTEGSIDREENRK